ncbi:isopropylmalate/homocitrate/citramalate synthase [Oceanicola sp. 22II-s10i]|uniref:ketosteroid isomerase-related protein n=1 Tax=Oceanicola sp. 22II-s10i TaxID=1317116 RepID=UPI000B5231BE|nr:ketosteroid isomerase-related protein [Oceanicola sp. 22II-s10i]OWU84105.1 isopropylmalate/homocitrate/citramalate synthase [Oceanicola sp. 22II-s10i]
MHDVIHRYFNAFNAKDTEAMLACVTEDLAHHVNEGQVRTGRAAFAEFCAHMCRCYDERLTEMVIFTAEGGTRGAAEYMVNGTYLETDAGLPEARGQTYRLPAGSFFTLTDGLISRVTTYYNLADWLRQVK